MAIVHHHATTLVLVAQAIFIQQLKAVLTSMLNAVMDTHKALSKIKKIYKVATSCWYQADMVKPARSNSVFG